MARSNEHPADMLHRTVSSWRTLFTPIELKEGEKYFQNTPWRSSNNWYHGTSYIFGKTRAITVMVTSAPSRYDDDWSLSDIRCSHCQTFSCIHKVAGFMAYEKEHGPVVVWESMYEYKQRKAHEAFDAKRALRDAEDRTLGLDPIPVDVSLLGSDPESGILIFDVPAAVAAYKTTPAAVSRIKEAEKALCTYNASTELVTSREGSRMVSFSLYFNGDYEYEIVSGVLSAHELRLFVQKEAKDYNSFYYVEPDPRKTEPHHPDKPLDPYELVTISRVWKKANEAGQEKITDAGALKFFSSIRRMQEKDARKEPRTLTAPEKKKNIEILPRIVITDGDPVISYKIGVAGNRLYVLKDCYTLIQAVQDEKEYVLGKKESLDFSRQTFTEESGKLFDFIQRNKSESYANVYQLNLKGARLDNFYDMYHGGQCELLDKTNNIKDELVTVGHEDTHFKLTASRLADARGRFIGVAVSGFVPVYVSGAANKYTLSRTALSRISRSELEVLSPFLSVADSAGFFRFQVGIDKLQEFYYRVLPPLLNNPIVEFDDQAGDEASAYLPPEPVFNFYLDLNDAVLFLHSTVQYDALSYDLTPSAVYADGEYHDTDQEHRVLKAIQAWFPGFDEDSSTFIRQVSDDELYDFLTTGLSSIEFYGQVHGTSAFQKRHVLPQPRVQVGISVESGGILNISVTSKELSSAELLDIYNSYRQKKRFHKMKSGDFIDLTQNTQFSEMEALLESTDMNALDAIRGKVHLPIFRALYLNKMLEQHDQLAVSRDRTYRALIRNFSTVRDAEYEVPRNLENTLRPYQIFGYKWLRTLQEAGFGGILADEMGLGKTVQMISLFQAAHDAAKTEKKKIQPALVICPASLVYNWQNEVERFAPDLKTEVIAGSMSARKKILTDCQDTDVLITSYDLLKRDFVLYEKLQFSSCVLDEAQFIKNHRAAVSKSVKLIHADHRYALTGTPIENRLSELWSIFDFLMPGFLYSQTEFERKFEVPVTKYKDEEATAKLKGMTGPFILRRKKEDVLTDLPAKLEEVRYARLDGEQQKIYDAQVVRMKEMLKGGELAGDEKIRMFAELTRIRQICCDPSLLFDNYHGESAKREACLDLIRSAIEGGHRMLVFSQFVSMLSLLEEDLKSEGIEYYKIIGATSKEKRITLVRSFNEGTVPVFLISLKAGGTGLNLTGADMVIHYDPWWNLAAQNQATDRAHRIGQTRQVTVFRLILKNTIEERIMELQDAKKDLAEAILEGRSESLLSLSSEELLALLG